MSGKNGVGLNGAAKNGAREALTVDDIVIRKATDYNNPDNTLIVVFENPQPHEGAVSVIMKHFRDKKIVPNIGEACAKSKTYDPDLKTPHFNPNAETWFQWIGGHVKDEAAARELIQELTDKGIKFGPVEKPLNGRAMEIRINDQIPSPGKDKIVR